MQSKIRVLVVLIFLLLTLFSTQILSQSLIHVEIVTTWVPGTELLFNIRGDEGIKSPLRFDLDIPEGSPSDWQHLDETNQVYGFFWVDCYYEIAPNIMAPAGDWVLVKDSNKKFDFFPHSPIPPGVVVVCPRRVPESGNFLTDKVQILQDLGAGYWLDNEVFVHPPQSIVTDNSEAFTVSYTSGISYHDSGGKYDFINMTFAGNKLPSNAILPISIGFFTSDQPNTINGIPNDDEIYFNDGFVTEMGYFASFSAAKISFDCGDGIRLFFDGEGYYLVTSPKPMNNNNISCAIPINLAKFVYYLEFTPDEEKEEEYIMTMSADRMKSQSAEPHHSLNGHNNSDPGHDGDDGADQEPTHPNNTRVIHFDQTLFIVVFIGGSYTPLYSFTNTANLLSREQYSQAEQIQTIAEARNLSTIMSPTNSQYIADQKFYYFGLQTKALTSQDATITLTFLDADNSFFTLNDLINNSGVAFRAYYTSQPHPIALLPHDTAKLDPSSPFLPLPNDAVEIIFTSRTQNDKKNNQQKGQFALATLENVPPHAVYLTFEFEFQSQEKLSVFDLSYSINGIPYVWHCAPRLIPSKLEYTLIKPTVMSFQTTLQFDFSDIPLLAGTNSTLPNRYAIQYHPGPYEIRAPAAVNQTECNMTLKTSSRIGNQRTMIDDSTNRLEIRQKLANYGNSQYDSISNWFLLLHASVDQGNVAIDEYHLAEGTHSSFNPYDVITITCTLPLNPNLKPNLDDLINRSYITIADFVTDTIVEYYFDGISAELSLPDEKFVELRQKQFKSLQDQYFGFPPNDDEVGPAPMEHQNIIQQDEVLPQITMESNVAHKRNRVQQRHIGHPLSGSKLIIAQSKKKKQILAAQIEDATHSFGDIAEQTTQNAASNTILNGRHVNKTPQKQISPHNREKLIQHSTKEVIQPLFTVSTSQLTHASKTLSKLSSINQNHEHSIKTDYSSLQSQESDTFTITSTKDLKLPSHTPSKPIQGVISELQYYFYQDMFPFPAMISNHKINGVDSKISFPEIIEWNHIGKTDMAILISFAANGNFNTNDNISKLFEDLKALLLTSTPSNTSVEGSLFANLDTTQLLQYSPWSQYMDGFWFPYSSLSDGNGFPVYRLDRIASTTTWVEFGIPLSLYSSSPETMMLLDEYHFYQYILRNSPEIYFWDFETTTNYQVPTCSLQWYQSDTIVEHVPGCHVPIGALCYSSSQCFGGGCIGSICVNGLDMPHHYQDELFSDYLTSQDRPTAKYFNNSFQLTSILAILVGFLVSLQ